MIFFEFGFGGKHDFSRHRVELHEVEGVEGGWEEAKSVEVGCGRFAAIEIIDEAIDEGLFFGGDGDRHIFHCDEGAFFRYDEVHKMEGAHRAPDIRARSHHHRAVLCSEKIVSAEIGVGCYPFALAVQKLLDPLDLFLIEFVLRTVEIKRGEKNSFPRVVEHPDPVIEEITIED